MFKRIDFKFEYDGTTQGDTDRDSFKTTCDTELTNNNVIPNYGGNENSFVTLAGDIVHGSIFYSPDNAGITAFNTFWSTLGTELAKTTVVGTEKSCRIKHNCRHDSGDSCTDYVNDFKA